MRPASNSQRSRRTISPQVHHAGYRLRETLHTLSLFKTATSCRLPSDQGLDALLMAMDDCHSPSTLFLISYVGDRQRPAHRVDWHQVYSEFLSISRNTIENLGRNEKDPSQSPKLKQHRLSRRPCRDPGKPAWQAELELPALGPRQMDRAHPGKYAAVSQSEHQKPLRQPRPEAHVIMATPETYRPRSENARCPSSGNGRRSSTQPSSTLQLHPRTLRRADFARWRSSLFQPWFCSEDH